MYVWLVIVSKIKPLSQVDSLFYIIHKLWMSATKLRSILFRMVTDLGKLCLYLCLEILFHLGKKLCQEVKNTSASDVMHRRRVLMWEDQSSKVSSGILSTRLKCLTWGNLQHSPVHTMQNFVCFAKKSLNRKPFVVRMIFFAHQNFKVRWQNPLFLDSYPSLGHLILWTLPMNYFSFNWCFWSPKKFHVCVLSADKKLVKYKKFSNSVQAPNYIFCHSVNRAYASSLLSSLQITPHFCSRPMLN